MKQISIHEFATLIPDMSTEEYAELKQDIQANGLREPIWIYEGKLLDGRNRVRACDEVGVELKTQEFHGSKAEAQALVLSLNVHRRHLTREQKHKLIDHELKRDPTQSDRAIAAKTKVSHTTVAKLRREAETTGQIGQLKKRTGRDGKARIRQAGESIAKTPQHKTTEPRLLKLATIPLIAELRRRYQSNTDDRDLIIEFAHEISTPGDGTLQ